MRVFERNGHPLLIVPLHANVPRSALALYSPQTLVARAAKAFWGWSFFLGFAPGSHLETVKADASSPFMSFLAQQSCAEAGKGCERKLPGMAILAGNPFAPAPRYLVQVFSTSGKAVAVVKTGVGVDAAALIDREADFLESVARDKQNPLRAVPRILGRFSHEHLTAFAMEYVEGTSPRREDAEKIGGILDSWLDISRRVRVSEIGVWKRLAAASAGDPLFKNIEAALGDVEIHPGLFHGDFVPWNIKVSPMNGAWTVLDWERGEVAGLPGWDWFHYVVQSAMLVEKKSGPALKRVADEMLGSEGLQAYLRRAGLEGHEREWLLAYLLHCRDVLRPREPAPGVASLIRDFGQSCGS